MADTSKGLFAALGVILGLGGSQAADLVFGAYDRWHVASADEIRRQHENIERVIGVWRSGAPTEEKAILTGVLVQSGMVLKKTACSLVAFALTRDVDRRIPILLSSVFSQEERQEYFPREDCSLERHIDAPKVEGSPGPRSRIRRLKA